MSSQRVIIGNSLHVLKTMEAESIDLCVTSPPYWGLRDYGSAPEIYGGDIGEEPGRLVTFLHCKACGAEVMYRRPERC